MSLIISANADAVLAVARSQAIRLGHEYVGTEHVMYAMLLSDLGGFGAWIDDHGLSLLAVEQKLLSYPRPEPRPLHGIPMTPRLSQVLSKIVVDSSPPDEPKITVGRLLRGILRYERECSPRGVISEMLLASGKTDEDLDGSIAELEAMQEESMRRRIERGPQSVASREL